MKKKLLTLEDLINFCQKEKLETFSSKETGSPLSIMLPAQFEKDDKLSSSLLFVKIKAFHTGSNRNGSNVTYDAAKKAMKTMAYKPILANFTVDADGNDDFTSHDFIIDDDGNIEYYEKQIGSFTADEPYMEQDPEHEDRYYVYAIGAIPRDYTKAADIIERKNGTKVSVELDINELKYDSKNKELIFSDVEVAGITCLGVDPDTKEPIGEGMEGARADISDFSKQNNSVTFEINEDIKKFIQASIDEALKNTNSKGKEENNQMTKFEELLQKYGVSAEDITFEYEGLDDEALEAAFAEAFDGEGDPSADGNEPEPQNDSEGGETESEGEVESGSESGANEDFASISVTMNGVTKEFSVSLVEKLNALYTLVNETYGESDNEWYDVDADEEAKEVYMHGYFSGKHFKQKYSVKKDVFSLQGDRISVFAKYLTEDEIKQLDTMKSNYAEISDKLAKYEAEPEKMKILNSEDYSSISNSDEFEAFKLQDAHFDMSVDEVREKADAMLLNAAKAGKVEFSLEEKKEKKEVGMKKLPINDKKKSGRYGSMFSKR